MRQRRLVQLILVVALIISSFSPGLSLSVRAAPEPAPSEPVPPRVLGNGNVPIKPGPEMTGQELPALRTRTSHTYLGSDGTYQAQVFPGSINYQDANGAWQPIDNTLVAGSEKGVAYQNKANHYNLQLPPTLQAPVRISAGDAWVAFSLQGASGKASAKEATATYTDALPGLDVAYEASNDLVKETVTLRNATAPQTVSYALQLSPGLAATVNAAGGLDIGDGEGRIIFSLEKPFMIDAAGTRSEAVSLSLDQASGGNTFTVTADPAWLADSARQYPVIIDPSVQINPNPDCTLEAAVVNASYCTNTALWVGHDSVTGSTGRSLLQFDVQGAIGDMQVRVLQAQMGLYGYQSSNATTGAHVEIHRATRAWTSNTTWLTYDGSHNWTTQGGDFDASVAYSSDVSWQQAQTQWQWWFPTDLVQGWVDGSITNQGMLLKASSETASNKAYFTSTNSTDTAHWPYLKVIYYPWVGNLRYWTFDQHQLTDRLTAQVNVANGNLLLHQSDLTLQGTGLPLPLDQTYNSRVLYAGFHLGSWAFGTGDEILLSQYPRGDREFYGPSRYSLPFIRTSNGNYQTPSGIDATLKDNGSNSYTLTFNKTGVKYNFSADSLTDITDQNGNTISFSYDTNKHLTGITDTQGRVTTVTENASGFITQITDPASRTIQYGYDASNNLTSVTDAAGKQYQYAYSGYDLTQITDPKGNITKFGYDSQHRVTSLTRVTNVGAGTGPTWTYTYNTNNTTVETDPNNHTTTYTYDHMGRVTKTTDALGHEQRSSYTANSDVQTQTDAAGAVTNFSYDAKNNVTQAKLPTGATTNLAYADSAHPYYPSSQTDAQGNNLSYTYDVPGNLTKTTNGLSSQNQTSASYNGNGTLASVTDPRGSVGGVATTTSYGYDTKGNLTGITPPSPLGAIAITRDGVSRISSVTDGKGQTTSYTYDNLDRITQISYQGGATISYSYDDNGNLTSLTDNTGTTSFSYDALNRMTQKTLPSLSTISYGYDDVGNLTSLTDSSGTTLYGYDAVNRLTSLTDPSSQQTTFGYDANNRRTTTSYPNGVTMTQGYDSAGRLTSIVGKNSSGTVLTSFTYSYVNPATSKDSSLRYSMTDASGNKTSYSYDVLNRLTEAKTTNSGGTTIADYQYGYDAIGNRTSQTVNGTTTSFTYNAANELTTSGFSFDANGNQTASNTGLAMSYNTKDQTASITPPGSGAISMSYTGASQVERVSAGSTNYSYSVLGLNQETSSGTTAYTRDNQGTLVSERTPSGTYYYLFDGLGSTVALTDSTGAVKNTYSYDPYGTVTSSTGPVVNPYRFGGAYGAYTDSSGLLKIGQRFYDPSLGRWTQQDLVAGALTSPMTLNRYTYVACNPVNSIDPSGMVCVPDAVAVGIGGVSTAIGAAALLVPVPPTLVLIGIAAGAYATYYSYERLSRVPRGCSS